MLTNIRGELTSDTSSKEGYDLVGTLARLLNLTTEKDKDNLSHIMYPAMLQAAVLAGDLKRIEEIKGYVRLLSRADESNRGVSEYPITGAPL